MALKVKAQEKLQKIGKYEGTYRYIMMPELYTSLSQEKVIKEAALRSGVSKGIMQACWDAAGEVIKAWATEGHSVALPGLGTMRFGIRAKSVAKVDEVKAGLVTSRRIIFTPAIDLKEELAGTAIQITSAYVSDILLQELQRIGDFSGTLSGKQRNYYQCEGNERQTPFYGIHDSFRNGINHFLCVFVNTFTNVNSRFDRFIYRAQYTENPVC